jgi:hypothetical protein
MLVMLLLAANACGVTWDPVQVLPMDARESLGRARVLVPCRVVALPWAIREYLADSRSGRKLPMADPDKPWNASCMISDSVPSRQLIAAAGSDRRWVVHYREGGIGVQEVAIVLEVISADKVRTIWQGHCTGDREERRSVDNARPIVVHQCAASED